MDIGYLLWLQGIREGLPPVVEQFFAAVSAIAVSSALILLPCLLFWCLDKRAGEFVLFSFSLGTLCNQVVKTAVSCYRPWVRDPAVRPSALAIEQATGYSFPSGHTQASANLVGAIGWFYRRRWRALFVACWVIVLLVAFSRNFLGVHTPQDVVVALAEAVLVIVLIDPLLRWIDQRDGRDALVAVASLAVAVFVTLFVMLWPYPQDYDSAGHLLVDPFASQCDSLKAVGVFAGAILGWYLERRFVRFVTDPRAMGWKRLVFRLVVGMAVVLVLHVAPRPLLVAGLDERWYELIKNFVTLIGATFVAPLVFTAAEKPLFERGRARQH